MKYEYKILDHTDEEEINRLAKDGWKAVSIATSYQYVKCVLMERELRE
jgi:hypothetical protein